MREMFFRLGNQALLRRRNGGILLVVLPAPQTLNFTSAQMQTPLPAVGKLQACMTGIPSSFLLHENSGVIAPVTGRFSHARQLCGEVKSISYCAARKCFLRCTTMHGRRCDVDVPRPVSYPVVDEWVRCRCLQHHVLFRMVWQPKSSAMSREAGSLVCNAKARNKLWVVGFSRGLCRNDTGF